MKLNNVLINTAGRYDVFGVPDGVDALVLQTLSGGVPRAFADIIHVARDEGRMTRLSDSLACFAPAIKVLALPAWDCLPYDRVSPHSEVVSRRIETLAALAATPAAHPPRLVLTTVNAILQRLPPRKAFAGAVLHVRKGESLGRDKLIGFLVRSSFRKAETVREPGEYAVRGGILDFFPPGTSEPVRLDFFGDRLEAIRSFDPVSQRSAGQLAELTIMPVAEIQLDAEAITRFRSAYRELFGAAVGNDPLYEAVSAGQHPAGMEHFLPLFHERMETLFDYLPGAALTLDYQADGAIAARFEQIAEFHQARLDFASSKMAGDTPVYHPLRPDQLYFGREEWAKTLRGMTAISFSPFSPPDAGSPDGGGRRGRDFADARSAAAASGEGNVFDAAVAHVRALQSGGRRVLLAAYSRGAAERLAGLMRDHGSGDVMTVSGLDEAELQTPQTLGVIVLALEQGFVAPGLAVIAEQDILGDRLVRPVRRKRSAEHFLAEASALAAGDLVVHADHGIGRYDGLVPILVAGAPHDCLRVLYSGGDKLFVPVENIEVLSRYGSEDSGVELDKLGGVHWQARRARVRERISQMAEALIKVAAERQLRAGEVMAPPDGSYQEFCARFPFPETEDQARAIDDTLVDLASGRPLDRLICGDVGFGKTEVALRAAFVAAMAGTQVAVVTPTTLLCRQHFQTFTRRFAGFGLRVEQLSRLVAPKRATEIKRDLAEGNIGVVVGTHALLSKSIAFKSLGLLVVDEEQHFGVAQKERLKQLRANVHVLTLTATPIPRTLQMALAGVRDMSVIATPPVDRLAVRTFVLPYDPVVVREAIMRERFRGGQVFYVCPRIEDLPKLSERLSKLVPEARIAMAHGRLPAIELERVMTAFYDGKYDILLSTNIIESGLDIPTANTLIVHRSDMFGLAQLYQLRGRVGRSKLRAYAYLSLPADRTLRPVAQRRLEVMQTLDSLGAGFQLASHDLDIRGAGNLLGEEQSGHIREVGIELYQHMLEEAVAAARGGGLVVEDWTPQISIGTPVLIPEPYVADLSLRLSLYRRIATLVDRAEIDAFAAEMIDRFGPLPAEVENLLQLIAIKRLCKDAGVEKLEAGPKGIVVSFRENRFANPEKLVGYITRHASSMKLRPDQRLVVMGAWENPKQRVAGIRSVLHNLVTLAA